MIKKLAMLLYLMITTILYSSCSKQPPEAPFFPTSPYIICSWGEYGTGNGQFHDVHGLVLDDYGNVYAVDSNDRVQKFDGNGNYILQWGSAGSGNGQFDYARSIGAGINGYIYVVDQNNNRIQIFDSTGVYLSQFGQLTWMQAYTGGIQGLAQGTFFQPHGMAVDPAGNVFVTDNVSENSNYRIQKFDSYGNYITKWPILDSNGLKDSPIGLAADSHGNIYVSDWNHNRIQKYNNSGVFITQWGSTGTTDGQFNNPTRMTVDNNDNVFVIDEGNHRVQKFDSDGNYLSKWGGSSQGNRPLYNCHGIAVDDQGVIYLTGDFGSNGKEIHKFVE